MCDRLVSHGRCPSRSPPSPWNPAQPGPNGKGRKGSRRWPLPVGGVPRRTRFAPCGEKFGEFGLDARAFSGVKIACVGEATPIACVRSASIPSWCPPVSSRRSVCSTSSRRMTRCSIRSTGCCCPGPTSPPRSTPRACVKWVGDRRCHRLSHGSRGSAAGRRPAR